MFPLDSMSVSLPPGKKHELLTPWDSRQPKGGTAVYPLAFMEVGDYFVWPVCGPNRADSIRAAVVYYRRKHPERRFAVKRVEQILPGAVVCARVS